MIKYIMCYLPEILHAVVLVSVYILYIISRLNISFIISKYFSWLYLTLFLIYINQSYNTTYIDNDFAVLKILIALLAFIFFTVCNIQAYNGNKKLQIRSVYFILYASGIFSFLLMLIADNLIMIYICIELYSFVSIILMITCYNKTRRLITTLYYFVISTFSSCIYLLGFIYLYSLTGSLNLLILNDLFLIEIYDSVYYKALTTIIIIIFIGFSIKIGIIPFHFWMLNLYKELTFQTLFYFLFFSKVYVTIVLLKIMWSLNALWFVYSYIFIILGIFNVVGGCLIALFQKELKNLLICSSLTNIGYIFLAVSYNIKSAITYKLLYIILSSYWIALVSLYVILELAWVWNINLNSDKDIKSIIDLLKLPSYVRILFSINILSLIGFPPLAGFIIKAFISYQCILLGYTQLAIIILFSSLLTLTYYLNFLKILLFVKKSSYKLNYMTKLTQLSCVNGTRSSEQQFIFTRIPLVDFMFWSFIYFYYINTFLTKDSTFLIITNNITLPLFVIIIFCIYLLDIANEKEYNAMKRVLKFNKAWVINVILILLFNILTFWFLYIIIYSFI